MTLFHLHTKGVIQGFNKRIVPVIFWLSCFLFLLLEAAINKMAFYVNKKRDVPMLLCHLHTKALIWKFSQRIVHVLFCVAFSLPLPLAAATNEISVLPWLF